jgi:hypothetical protein
MDLGAPIIDVISTTPSDAASGIKPSNIISGGVVAAKGYDPVVVSPSFINT